MKGISKEVKIGVVAVIGLVVLFFGLQFLKGLNLFSNTNTYTMVFDNVNRLGTAAPIYANGVKVGHVGTIKYDYQSGGDILVSAEIDKQLQVPQNARAEIESDLMGNMKINLIFPNKRSDFLQPGGQIDGRLYSGALDKAGAMVPEIQEMLPKLDSILASVNTLLASPALVQSLQNMEVITSNLKQTSHEATELMRALNSSVPSIASKADGILGTADNAMGSAQILAGNLSKVDVAPTIELVNTTLTSTNEAMAKLTTSMSDINKLTADLNSQKGSLGKLMNDPNLYNNLSNTARSADSLLTDLKAHPKRYVHFSIFGKKDK